ncbi:PABIR family member 2-like isoform X1 [Lampetra planeri]
MCNGVCRPGLSDRVFRMAQECMELEFCGESMPENALRRSNSLPMINNACESFQVTMPGFPRQRRNSISLSGGHSLEEGMDVMNRESTAQDRDVQAAMQVGQPWEDFSLCEQMCDTERPAAPASTVSAQRRTDSFPPPLPPPPPSCPAAAASSASSSNTRAFGRQLFAPSLQQAVVSGGGGAFFQRRPQPARRSNSPGSCPRPGTFGCLKRKVDPSNEMPSKRSFTGPAAAAATLLSTSPEFPIMPHPLTHSLSWSSLESGGSCSPPQKVPPSGPQPEAPKADTFLPPFTPASRPSAM